MPRKTEFELERINTDTRYELCIVTDDEGKPVVELSAEGIRRAYIKDRDLERFAVNILKALGSKKLALSQRYKSKDFFKKKKTTTHG